MPLPNFGSILSFAEELEIQDRDFYLAAARNPACSEVKELFESFAADGDRQIKTVQRVRRENVTEMILENIEGFTRAPFCEECDAAGLMTAAEAMDTARRLEERSRRYYLEAADKLKSLSEASRALKTLAKKHAAHLEKLN